MGGAASTFYATSRTGLTGATTATNLNPPSMTNANEFLSGNKMVFHEATSTVFWTYLNGETEIVQYGASSCTDAAYDPFATPFLRAELKQGFDSKFNRDIKQFSHKDDELN